MLGICSSSKSTRRTQCSENSPAGQVVLVSTNKSVDFENTFVRNVSNRTFTKNPSTHFP